MNQDEFLTKYSEIIIKTIKYSKKARTEGLLALEDVLDEEKVNNRDIFEYGLRFVIDGTDYRVINDIMGIMIEMENDKYKKLLMRLQAEAVLSIQAGDNPRIIFYKLNAFTNYSLSEDPGAKYLDEAMD